MSTDHEARVREIADSIEFLDVSNKGKAVSAIAKALSEEREACAKIAETNWMVMKMYGNPYATGASNAGDKIASAIRSRREKDNG